MAGTWHPETLVTSCSCWVLSSSPMTAGDGLGECAPNSTHCRTQEPRLRAPAPPGSAMHQAKLCECVVLWRRSPPSAMKQDKAHGIFCHHRRILQKAAQGCDCSRLGECRGWVLPGQEGTRYWTEGVRTADLGAGTHLGACTPVASESRVDPPCHCTAGRESQTPGLDPACAGTLWRSQPSSRLPLPRAHGGAKARAGPPHH